MTVMRILGAVLIALVLTGHAAAQTPLERHLKTRGYELPNTIDYEDFYYAALDDGMVEVEEELAKYDVEIVGEGDSRYIRRADLLRLCGKDCRPDRDWGYLIRRFAVIKHIR